MKSYGGYALKRHAMRKRVVIYLKLCICKNDDIMSRMMTNDDKMMTYYMMTSKHVTSYYFLHNLRMMTK